MSGYNTNNTVFNGNQQGPHGAGTEQPYPPHHSRFRALMDTLASEKVIIVPRASNPPADFINPPPHIPLSAFQDLRGGDRFPDYHANDSGYTVNPQIPAHYRVDKAIINRDQVPQWTIDRNQYQASYNFGQQQTQIQSNHTSTMEQSISRQFQFPSINYDQPFPTPVYAPNNNGHDISQQMPAQFHLGGTPAYCGQQPQMPVNQTNVNGVNNNQQACQGMATAGVSSFASLSAQEQDAEFQHFVQRRVALGETKPMEPEMFKSWYIGQQRGGNITPTLEHGVTPLHPSLLFNNNVPVQQPLIPLNNQGCMQPSTMVYQNTGVELTTGFQHMMGPPTTLSGQAMQPPTMIYQNTGVELTTGFQHMMGPPTNLSGQPMQPNNEQYLQQPRNNIRSDMQARRTSLAVASAGQSILPGSSRSMARPVLSITTTMPAPPSTTERPAPPSMTTMPAPLPITRVEAPPSTTTMPASSSTIRAQAPPSMTTMPAPSPITKAQAPPSITARPAITRRNKKPQNVNSQQMGIRTCATVKKTSQEQETEAGPSNQHGSISIDQILGAAAGTYTVSFLELPEVGAFDDSYSNNFYHFMDSKIEALDVAKPDTKVYMLRNAESVVIVKRALGEILRQVISLSVETSSDEQQSLKNYAATKKICYSSIKSLEFSPKSEFIEGVKVACGTEQTAQLAKDDVPSCATHTLMCATINIDLDGTEVKGSWSLYTKTAFIDESTPLKYAIGLKMEVAEIGNRHARNNLLIYERSLPSNITGEPLWADVIDLFKLQAAEWGMIRQSITPEPLTVRGEKRKSQHQPEIHASPDIHASSSEAFNSSSDQANSPTSNTSTDRTSASPQPVAGAPRSSDNSRPIKRSRNGNEMGLLEGGTGMRRYLPSSIQPPANRISQNDHMHPARSISEIVRSPSTTDAPSRMPAQVSAQADESFSGAQVAPSRQGMLIANNERPYQETISELTQPSRTFSAPSNMPRQEQLRLLRESRLLRQPTEEELAPHKRNVMSKWKPSFPVGKESS